MVLKDYRYRCFDDCTQVSPRPRPSAKSFFYTRYARQSLCAKCTAGNERSANLKILARKLVSARNAKPQTSSDDEKDD